MKNKKLNIGLIWLNPKNKNLGVGALAYSSIAMIESIIKEKNIDANIIVIGGPERSNDSVFINGNKINYITIPGVNFLSWKTFIKLFLFPQKYGLFFLNKIHILFDIGEGDSFTDIYGNARFKKLLNSKLFFNFLNTKQILLPQTIGPFVSKDNEKAAFKIMAKLKKIICRDKKSYDYSALFLSQNQILESVDIAFYLPFTKVTRGEDGFEQIGLNVSSLLWNGGYTKQNQFNLKLDYQKTINEIISYFVSIKHLRLHLISHVMSDKSSIENDYEVANSLHTTFPTTVLAPLFGDPIEAKSYISGMNFFVGARMHACIAAFSSGVPVFPMAYSRKFTGLFCDTLNFKWVGDCTHSSQEEILEQMKAAYASKDMLKNKIEESNKTIVLPRLNQLKNYLGEVLENA